jgi:hypothetical protein
MYVSMYIYMYIYIYICMPALHSKWGVHSPKQYLLSNDQKVGCTSIVNKCSKSIPIILKTCKELFKVVITLYRATHTFTNRHAHNYVLQKESKYRAKRSKLRARASRCRPDLLLLFSDYSTVRAAAWLQPTGARRLWGSETACGAVQVSHFVHVLYTEPCWVCMRTDLCHAWKDSHIHRNPHAYSVSQVLQETQVEIRQEGQEEETNQRPIGWRRHINCAVWGSDSDSDSDSECRRACPRKACSSPSPWSCS